MEILTIDKRKLHIVRIGDPDCEALANRIYCLDKKGKRHVITWREVEGTWGSLTAPPVGIKPLKDEI